MRNLFAFLAAMVALFILAPAAHAADVDFALAWDAPAAGGPVTDYRATCTDSAGATVLDVTTAGLTAAASATGVAEGAGTCSLVARGPGGESAPVVASWSISVILPPGVPSNFRITLDCTVVDGTVVCEQV